MFLVVGLGNPGRKYVRTRHNVGFLVVELLASRWGIDPERKQANALLGDGLIGSERAVLVRPQTFMNLSGQPVRALLDFYKLTPAKVLVIHDDVDLPFGDVRVKVGGGHGGHNGLRDISRHCGPDYGRVRVGVSRPPEGWDTADYVLGTWTADETATLPDVVEQAANAVESSLRDGLSAAMNTFNTRERRRPGTPPDTRIPEGPRRGSEES